MLGAVKSGEQLCRACGLCCDGTLFDLVKLEPGDDAGKLKALGLPVSLSRGQTPVARFPQPCSALCEDRTCRVYAERPWQCRTFECQLFKDAKAGRIAFAAALPVVKQARRRADTASSSRLPISEITTGKSPTISAAGAGPDSCTALARKT